MSRSSLGGLHQDSLPIRKGLVLRHRVSRWKDVSTTSFSSTSSTVVHWFTGVSTQLPPNWLRIKMICNCAAVSGLPLNPRHKTVFRAPMKWAPRVCQHTSNIWERRMEPEVWSAIRWMFLFFPSTDGCYELESFGWSDGTPLISSCLLPW